MRKYIESLFVCILLTFSIFCFAILNTRPEAKTRENIASLQVSKSDIIKSAGNAILKVIMLNFED